MTLRKINKTDYSFGYDVDGSITRTSDGNENGLLDVTNYKLESGYTRTVTDGYLFIHASNEIIIDGNFDSTPFGGGVGGSNNSNGEDGATGLFGVEGGGGDNYTGDNGGPCAGGGGTSYDANNAGGGNGGDAHRAISDSDEDLLKYISAGKFDTLYNSSLVGTSAGGGGGSGQNGPDGGDGGGSGALIVLFAPKISINGSFDLPGGNGQDGVDNSNNGASGGGGGGSGGSLVAYGREVNQEAGFSFNAPGGTGGIGGTCYNYSDSSNEDAGDGGDGLQGRTVIASKY